MIISSIIKSDSVQLDNRRWIHEIHTDNSGVEHERWYLCSAQFDAQAALVEYAAQLNQQITFGDQTNGNT